MNPYDAVLRMIEKEFGHDTVIGLATTDGERPYARNVNAFYEDGAFYVVTYTLSNKMRQIEKNPNVAVCGAWFTAQGIGESLGWVREEKNAEMMSKLRAAFAEWYDNGHTNEEDPNTCLLRVKLTSGVLLNNGMKYDIDFPGKRAEALSLS